MAGGGDKRKVEKGVTEIQIETHGRASQREISRPSLRDTGRASQQKIFKTKSS